MKPRREIKKVRRNDYFRYLFLEYNGKDLHELKYKTCHQVGIKEDSELMLKFKEYNNQININNEKEKMKRIYQINVKTLIIFLIIDQKIMLFFIKV